MVFISMKFLHLFHNYVFSPFLTTLFVLRYADLENCIWSWTRAGLGLPVWRHDSTCALGFERSWLYKYLRTMLEFPDTAQYMYDALKQSHDIGQDKWTVAYAMELQCMRADRDMNVDINDAAVYGVIEEIATHDLKERRDKLKSNTTFHY